MMDIGHYFRFLNKYFSKTTEKKRTAFFEKVHVKKEP